MKALILAGGFGTRLREVISDRPKVMAPVAGKPFLQHLIQLLRRNGFTEIVISLGYLGDYIRAYFGDGTNFGVKIEYAVEDFPMGTGGALKNAERFFNESFLVINGDTYIDTNLSKFYDYHISNKSLATISLVKKTEAADWGWVSINKTGKVVAFIEKPKEDKAGWVSGGYYIFSPKIFKYIETGKKVSIEKQIFPLLTEKKILQAFPLSEDFMEIGKPENYEKVKEYFSHKKNMVIEVKVPVRVSFAGGGTDMPEYFLKHGGRVLSASVKMFVNLYIKTTDEPFIKINLKDFKREETYPLNKILPYDGGIFDLPKAVINRLGSRTGMDVEVWGDFPAGSGLGSSSAVCAAFITALSELNGNKLERSEVARIAVEIERDVLKIPGGWQDQFAVSYGGINLIEFTTLGKVRIKPVGLEKRIVSKFEKNLMLFYVGAKRSEKEQQTGLRKSINIKKNIESFEVLKKLVTVACDFMLAGKVKDFGEILSEEWLVKKVTNKNVTDPRIDKLLAITIKNGAYGGKLLGAGGGGVMLIAASEKSQQLIVRNLKKQGVMRLPMLFDFDGVQKKSYES